MHRYHLSISILASSLFLFKGAYSVPLGGSDATQVSSAAAATVSVKIDGLTYVNKVCPNSFVEQEHDYISFYRA